MRGIDEVRKGDDATLMEHLLDIMAEASDGTFTFANFVNSTVFTAIVGMFQAMRLRWNGFDTQMPRIEAAMRPGDLVLFTADHGNDPTWIGTDHTRERVPVLGLGVGCKADWTGRLC